MKRIVSREFPTSLRDSDQSLEYSSIIANQIPTLDIDNDLSVPLKYEWCKKIIENMLSRGVVIGTALDVGCANGGLTAILASIQVNGEYALTVDAIEPYTAVYDKAEVAFSKCRKCGMRINSYNKTFDEFRPIHNYDVVIAFDIVEHMRDPLAFIEQIYDMLDVGGCLFLTTPEQSGRFGISDANRHHYWTASVQSLVFVLFNDDRKWKLELVHEYDGVIMLLARKKNFMGV